MEPFRVFLALLVNLALVLASAALVIYARLKHPQTAITPAMHRFPRRSVLSIAALDALQLAVMVRCLITDKCKVITDKCKAINQSTTHAIDPPTPQPKQVVAGASTPPVLTVLFMQATLPFSLLLSALLAKSGATSFPRYLCIHVYMYIWGYARRIRQTKYPVAPPLPLLNTPTHVSLTPPKPKRKIKQTTGVSTCPAIGGVAA